jgi:serine/threonine-protein kinase RsbW/sigma-B regulation protein RsbU (phosphoserine phosphatase)
MTAQEQREWRARMACLHDAVAFIEDFCRRHGVSGDDARRLSLIAEELFTNTVRHGHGGDSDAPVRIALGLAGAHLELRFEDSAPAFDPRPHLDAAQATLHADADERQVGGLGLHLVAQLVERLDYSFLDGFNRLRLVVRREV